MHLVELREGLRAHLADLGALGLGTALRRRGAREDAKKEDESASHRIPGSMPFMPRIMRCRLPPFIIFIIFCICSNWLSSWLTACTLVPAPAAMRRLREALMSS